MCENQTEVRPTRYLSKVVNKPLSFEEFRKSESHVLTPLVTYLVGEMHHPSLVAALMSVGLLQLFLRSC